MGRHAAADDVDDEALATGPSRPGAHRADTGPVDLVARPAGKRARTQTPPATAPRKKGTT